MSAQPQEHTEKFCPRCKRHLSTAAFGPNRTAHDGLDGYCRPCRRADHRERWPSSQQGPHPLLYRGDERWDIDRLTARIEAANAADLANGGGIFTKRGEG